MAREDAEQRVAQVFSAGSPDQLARAYDDWADSYDDDMQSLGLRGAAVVAALATRYLHDRAAPILDAGAGTGLVGELLAIVRYEYLVALDLSVGMLARARVRGVYRELHQGALGETLAFADEAFAAVVAAGVFTTGHAPPESFEELLRVTRAGGHLIFTLATPAFNQGGFRDKLDVLERTRRWRLVEATVPFRGLPASEVYREHTARVLVLTKRRAHFQRPGASTASRASRGCRG